MSFNGNEDHRINLDEAIELTKNFRKSVFPGDLLAGFFGKATLQRMLNQDGCVGIRIYYGLTTDKKPSFVLVGVNADEEDLYQGELAEYATPCPPFCDPHSPLANY
jgi:hypothetical protein